MAGPFQSCQMAHVSEIQWIGRPGPLTCKAFPTPGRSARNGTPSFSKEAAGPIPLANKS